MVPDSLSAVVLTALEQFVSTSRQNIALCLSSCLHDSHETTDTKKAN